MRRRAFRYYTYLEGVVLRSTCHCLSGDTADLDNPFRSFCASVWGWRFLRTRWIHVRGNVPKVAGVDVTCWLLSWQYQIEGAWKRVGSAVCFAPSCDPILSMRLFPSGDYYGPARFVQGWMTVHPVQRCDAREESAPTRGLEGSSVTTPSIPISMPHTLTNFRLRHSKILGNRVAKFLQVCCIAGDGGKSVSLVASLKPAR